jgi:prepilin-type N-terminal cleavage/methylation domain-containing protein
LPANAIYNELINYSGRQAMNKSRAFILIELLVVIAVIAILIGILSLRPKKENLNHAIYLNKTA